ncbi:hypothetical protein AAMO2058_001594200 [Amorphochlora amoebiformis]
MTNYLIFKPSPYTPDAQLEIMLQGMVTAKMIKGIQMRLMLFKARVPQVASMIPMLRVEKGYWTFKSQCPSIHHPQILIECFLEVFEELGFKPISKHSQIHSFAPPGATLFKSEEKGLEHCILPDYGKKVGGDLKKEVQLNPLASVDMLPNSALSISEIAEKSEGRVVFGVGWGQTQDKTAKMLGLPQGVDIDLVLYVTNKYGEVIRMLSPKGNRALNKKTSTGMSLYAGIRISMDSKKGNAEGDDERFILEPDFFPKYVHSIVVALQIQSGAASFRDVFDVYLRILDTSRQGIENEHVIFRLDPSTQNLNHRGGCAIMARILRVKGKGFVFHSMGHITAVAEQDLRPGWEQQLPSAVTFSGFRVKIPACDAKGAFKQADQGYSDPYLRFYIEYWVKASKLTPSMNSLKGEGHWRKSHHGLVLKAGARGNVIVAQVVNETPAKVTGFRKGDWITQMNGRHAGTPESMKRYLDSLEHRTPVRFIVYRQGRYVHLNMRIGGPIERKRNFLWKSKVKTRVPCPETVDFTDSGELKVQVASMTGKLKDRNTYCLVNGYGLVVVDCMDHDRMSRDDKIFRHEMNMDQLFDEDLDTDSDWFSASEQRPVDYTIKSNGSFVHCMLYLKAKRFP